MGLFSRRQKIAKPAIVTVHVSGFFTPALVAQSDARPTGDQEVAGTIPAEVGNILS